MISAVVIVLILVIVFLLLAIYEIISLGGKSFWNYIKSKFKGKRPTGGWFLKIGNTNRVSLEYKEIPKDRKIKLKSSSDKSEEIFADLSEVKMYKDEDGCPVYMLKEDLPFPLFVHKFNFDKIMSKIKIFKDFLATEKIDKNETKYREFAIEFNSFLVDSKLSCAYLHEALNVLSDLEIIMKSKDKDFVNELVSNFNVLEDILITRNYTFVNIADIFKSSEYIRANQRNLINMYYTGYYEGLRANTNWKDILLIIMVAAAILAAGYGAYISHNMDKKVDGIQAQISEIKNILDILPKDINGHMVIMPENQAYPIQPIATNTIYE